jgi:ABC-type Mn2+/Zn2+ transport system permease subunit
MSVQDDYGAPEVKPATRVFWGLFAVIYAAALLPPVYIWMGQQHAFVLGLPISAWYAILTCVVAIIVVAALYNYEYSGTEAED